MFDLIYDLLAKIGFHHPLHPLLVHLTLGLVLGGFLFLLGSKLLKKPGLFQAAKNCLGLALISIIPTALLGYMDWQHFYGGIGTFSITMKSFLAGVLLVLLIITVITGHKETEWSGKLALVFIFCFLIALGIGYFGGEVVYGNRVSPEDTGDEQVQKGGEIFAQKCLYCHNADSTMAKTGPGLKGLFEWEILPISGSVLSEANIRKQIKTPYKDMPAFGSLIMDELIAYLKTL